MLLLVAAPHAPAAARATPIRWEGVPCARSRPAPPPTDESWLWPGGWAAGRRAWRRAWRRRPALGDARAHARGVVPERPALAMDVGHLMQLMQLMRVHAAL